MPTIIRSIRAALLAVMLVTLVSPSLAMPAVAADERCFPETGFCISGRFRTFWEQQGGLAVFGFPVTAAREELNREDGRTYLTQWFERVRFEAHPENTPPYDVLLGRIGAERLQLARETWQDLPKTTGPQPGCRWFAETRHNVCDQAPNQGFLSFWSRNGLRDAALDQYGQSLALFGLPLSEATVKLSPTDGKPYLTQWFERARFEWHPEQTDAQYQVLLGLLGNEVLRAPRLIGGDSGGSLVAGGDLVAWVEPGEGTGFGLYLYNTTTDSRMLIASATGVTPQLAMDGRLLVWVEEPPDSAARVQLFDTRTGERRTLLTVNSSTDGFGRLAVGDGVVYVERRGGAQPGLAALDLASGVTRLISPTASRPVAAEGRLLWTETTSEGSGFDVRATHRLMLRTLAGSRADVEIAQLDDQSGFSRYAIADGRVVWGGFRTAISVYDSRTGASTAVAADGFSPTWLGGRVLWSAPLPNGLWAILAWDPATATTETVISEEGIGMHFVTANEQSVVYVRAREQEPWGTYRYEWRH